MPIEPYLFFNGRCEEAIGFYQQALDARLDMMMRYRESPDPCPEDQVPANWGDKVMHASLTIGGARLMVSDGNDSRIEFRGFALSLTLPDEADARRAFAALAVGGNVILPICKTFWSPCFGMVTDRFGVMWMVTVPAPGQGAA